MRTDSSTNTASVIWVRAHETVHINRGTRHATRTQAQPLIPPITFAENYADDTELRCKVGDFSIKPPYTPGSPRRIHYMERLFLKYKLFLLKFLGVYC